MFANGPGDWGAVAIEKEPLGCPRLKSATLLTFSQDWSHLGKNKQWKEKHNDAS